ncbi:MAG: response regulator [Chloroflexaceae bacterium]|nr:response regulator [Chloroflexaceae bacterium]
MQTARSEIKKGTILVVDDQSANLYLLVAMLQQEGYRVLSVSNGPMALKSARTNPPDLILLDICMPHMDGYETCQHLKQHETTRDIPVIFFSALDDIDDKVRGFEVGGVDYITRPFQIAEVLVRVATHLSLRQMHHQLREQNAQLQQEIARRQKVEDTLRQTQQQYAHVVEAGKVALWEWDLETHRARMPTMPESVEPNPTNRMPGWTT